LKESFERFDMLECFGEGQGDRIVQEYLKMVEMEVNWSWSFFAGFACSFVESLAVVCYYIKIGRSPWRRTYSLLS